VTSPCFSLFSDILDNVEKKQAVSSVAVFSFLKTVLANPFPKPGTTMTVKVPDMKTGQMQELRLSRPEAADPILEYVCSPLICFYSVLTI
jgi:hypothetical protein